MTPSMTQKAGALRLLILRSRRHNVAALYLMMVVGVLAHWFWSAGWAYLGRPEVGFPLGSTAVILVRVGLAFIAAALTFVQTYNKIAQTNGLTWVPYFLAFQNGFFWEAAMDAVISGFS